MLTLLVTLHVIICVLLVVTVLLQFGKGAEMGAVMGAGASQAVFSSSAKGNFLTKTTTILAIGFMINSIVLTTLKSREAKRSLFDKEAPIAAPLNSDVESLNKKAENLPAENTTAPAAATNNAETKTETTATNTAPAANTKAPEKK
jgi:preprotein translocase subunit SecG